MKSVLFLYSVAGCAALIAQGTVEQQADHHPGFHNEALYILEPMFEPGHSTQEHRHLYDGASVCIEGSVMRAKPTGGDWAAPRQLCRPGDVNVNEATGKPSSHTVENVGTVTTHLRLIENLREGGWTTFPPVNANGLNVMKESRAFRAYRVDPDSASHAHPVPTITVLISGQASTAGEKLDRAGAFVLIPAGQAHRVESEGKVVEVEVR